MVARLLWEQDAAGSSPVTPTISSVHNGFQLWTLDFFLSNGTRQKSKPCADGHKKFTFLFAFVIIFVAKISNMKYHISERSVFERGDRK